LKNWGGEMQWIVISSFTLGVFAGTLIGIIMVALCKVSSDRDNQDCTDCFGASMNDCGHCPHQEGGDSDDYN